LTPDVNTNLPAKGIALPQLQAELLPSFVPEGVFQTLSAKTSGCRRDIEHWYYAQTI